MPRASEQGLMAGVIYNAGRKVPEGLAAVGWRVGVYWTDDQKFYMGEIAAYNDEEDEYEINYDDSELLLPPSPPFPSSFSLLSPLLPLLAAAAMYDLQQIWHDICFLHSMHRLDSGVAFIMAIQVCWWRVTLCKLEGR